MRVHVIIYDKRLRRYVIFNAVNNTVWSVSNVNTLPPQVLRRFKKFVETDDLVGYYMVER